MPSSRSANARAIAADLTRVGLRFILPLRAKVAELVDAQGSGPCSPYRLWGFESPLSHQPSPDPAGRRDEHVRGSAKTDDALRSPGELSEQARLAVLRERIP